MPIRILMAKPSMYNYVGVGGLQGHAALRIVCVAFVYKMISRHVTRIGRTCNNPLKIIFASFVFQDEFLQPR